MKPHQMLPSEEMTESNESARAHGPAFRALPFQCQKRYLTEEGKQCGSLGPSTPIFSRMSEPTACRKAPCFTFFTSRHVPPAQRKTAQPTLPPQEGIATEPTIPRLPGPRKAPHKTW